MPIRPPSAESTTASIRNCKQHFVFERPHGQTQTDLARALGDTDEHDVHDPDTAHQQADGSHRAKQTCQDAHRAGQRFGKLLRVKDVEVVVIAVGELAALPHQLTQAGLERCTVTAFLHGDQQGAHFSGAGDASLQRMQGQDHDIVLIAHPALPLAGQNADDLAGELAHPQFFAQTGASGDTTEDLATHGFANDADGSAAALLVWLEEAATGQFPVAGFRTRGWCFR